MELSLGMWARCRLWHWMGGSSSSWIALVQPGVWGAINVTAGKLLDLGGAGKPGIGRCWKKERAWCVMASFTYLGLA